MTLLIMRVAAAMGLLLIMLHPHTPQHWRLCAGTVLGVGLIAVLIRDHGRNST